MRNKLSYLAIVLMLTGGLMGGCPTPDTTLDPNETTPTDNNGQPTDDSATDDPNSTDNGTDNGSTDNGTDNGNTDNGNTDNGNTDNGNTDNGNTDNGNTDNGNTSDAVLTGAFDGPLACTKSEAISGGTLGLEKTWNENFALEIDADGIPVEFTIPGYMQASGGIRFVAAIHQVGETVTLTETSGTYTVTLKATVALATYDATGGRVTLQLEHNGVKGALTEVGTGLCVIEFTADGNNVTYSSVTNYEVLLSGIVNTQWHVECSGTLSPQ